MSIALAGVSVAHSGGQVVLHQLDLNIAAGERVAIIGPSGAGKTSLLRLLGCSLPVQTGRFSLLEAEPGRLRGRALKQLRARIGLIHQSPPLPARQRVVTAVLAGRLGSWSTLRALASLCYPLDIPGARDALKRLDLDEKLFARCDELSGGQLQRVGIARVLYQQAELMLADEPVSAMDPLLADHTLGLLNDIAAERGMTLVASLHAVELALKHFPRVIALRDGRILFDRPAEQISAADLEALYANDSLHSTRTRPVELAGTGDVQLAGRIAPRCL